MKFFNQDSNVISKGEIKYNSGFVLDLRLVDYAINARIRAYVKAKS